VISFDSKLRGCDVVALKVDDVAPNGYMVERATVRQRKTRRPVKFDLTEHGKRPKTTCERWRRLRFAFRNSVRLAHRR
jgi:hypothetical protein